MANLGALFTSGTAALKTPATLSSSGTLAAKKSSVDPEKAMAVESSTDPVFSIAPKAVAPLFSPTAVLPATTSIRTATKTPTTGDSSQSILGKLSVGTRSTISADKGLPLPQKTAAIPLFSAKPSSVTSASVVGAGGKTFIPVPPQAQTMQDGDLEIDFEPLPGEYVAPQPFPWLLVGGLALVAYIVTRK